MHPELGNNAQLARLMGWQGEGDSAAAQVLFPESGQGAVSLPRGEIERRYAGIAIFAQPRFRAGDLLALLKLRVQ